MDIHHRIKEYRERLGYTQQAVAEAIKIPRETISTWENGKRRPQASALQKLAKFYQVPVAYLLGEMDLAEEQEREVLYRGIPQNGNVRIQIDGWLDFLDAWAEFLTSQGREIQSFKTPKKLDRGLEEDIRRASSLAVDVRAHYDLGLDAISDLAGFLDGIGILVYRAPLGSFRLMGSEQISGAYYNHPRLGSCILVNSDTTPGRQVFTLAHELAHAFYHYSAKGITSISGHGSDPKERFANVFAAHFLVPGKALRYLVQECFVFNHLDPARVMLLAVRMRVSYATMLMRLWEEKLISSEQRDEWKGSSPRSLALQLKLDPQWFEVPDSFVLEKIDCYPLSVLEVIKESLESSQISPSQAAQLLKVKEKDLTHRLMRVTSKASDQESLEFEELPW